MLSLAATEAPVIGDNTERMSAGLVNLGKLDIGAADRIMTMFQEVAPDFFRYIAEFQFGDLYSRPALDLRSRLIAAIAGLTALGTAQPQLKFHINAALNNGCYRNEVVEIIMQMAATAGFPAAFNSLLVVKEVFAERDAQGLDTKVSDHRQDADKTSGSCHRTVNDKGSIGHAG